MCRQKRHVVTGSLSPRYRAHLHRDIPRQVGRTQQLGDFDHGHAVAVRVLATVDEYVTVVAVLGRGQMQTRHRQQVPVHLDGLRVSAAESDARPRGPRVVAASCLGADRSPSRTTLTRESTSRSASRRGRAP